MARVPLERNFLAHAVKTAKVGRVALLCACRFGTAKASACEESSARALRIASHLKPVEEVEEAG